MALATTLSKFSSAKIQCTPGGAEDVVEVVATGNTVLRYDAIAGQFVYNWKTPSAVGCYQLTVRAADGTPMTAYFQLKK